MSSILGYLLMLILLLLLIEALPWVLLIILCLAFTST